MAYEDISILINTILTLIFPFLYKLNSKLNYLCKQVKLNKKAIRKLRK